jgi:hypothetical protein
MFLTTPGRGRPLENYFIARTLGRHLPQESKRVIDILVASLGPKQEAVQLTGMGFFLYRETDGMASRTTSCAAAPRPRCRLRAADLPRIPP